MDGNICWVIYGLVIVNVDELVSSNGGVAYLHPATGTLPNAVAFFTTPNKDNPCEFRISSFLTVDPATGSLTPWDNIKHTYPTDVVFSQNADVTASWNTEFLELSWRTDIGVTGTCKLPQI